MNSLRTSMVPFLSAAMLMNVTRTNTSERKFINGFDGLQEFLDDFPEEKPLKRKADPVKKAQRKAARKARAITRRHISA